MSLRSGKLPFLGSEDEFFTIRDIVPYSEFLGSGGIFADRRARSITRLG
jgi:hypothetical protein